jgi:hypothetical protein
MERASPHQLADPGPASSDHMPDFIIDIFEPCIICIIELLHPRTPSLAIPALTIARCLFISHFFGPSAIPPIIVVIFDRWVSEHIIMLVIILADAGLNARITVATMAAEITARFMLNTSRKISQLQILAEPINSRVPRGLLDVGQARPSSKALQHRSKYPGIIADARRRPGQLVLILIS